MFLSTASREVCYVCLRDRSNERTKAPASPVNNLRATTTTSATLLMLSMVMSSFLFLQRVQAVYAQQKWVRWTFFVLWVIFSASDILIPIGIHPTTIPGTHYYLSGGTPSYDASTVFTLLFFDTSVLIAISYKVASGYNSMPNERVPWYTLISGRALPRLSRAILRGGQQYYL